MLLLHHNLDGASGRTRTDECEFTKLALWLLRHRGKMASTAGIAPATSTFARWRSDLPELRGQLALGQLACVAGLAPARLCWKDSAAHTHPRIDGRLEQSALSRDDDTAA